MSAIDRRADALTHAGGVVFRLVEDRLECLLVRASRAPYEWVFPKGHVEEGETLEVAACREVREEAGVEAVLAGVIDDLAFTVDGKEVRVRYFLMRMVRSGLDAERREQHWCSQADAERLLAFDSAKRILRLAFAQAGGLFARGGTPDVVV
jgi:ADP-ribose pyrophosphatase YjhB (NUDIX family)